MKVISGEENYKTHYLVKIVALKGEKNFTNIKSTKSNPAILPKNYYVVNKAGK